MQPTIPKSDRLLGPGGTGKDQSRNPVAYADEKSDVLVVPEKLSNKGDDPAEMVEGRSAAKGNVSENPAPRTPSWNKVASMGLEGVRTAAGRDKEERFTALLHRITPQLLEQSFYALPKDAAVGVDAVTWRDYEEGLAQTVHALHREIHTGSYRATPSRRVYIPKADGKQRPLGIASLEDKVVQQAVVTVLTMIYEKDFLGFSYGFRPGRSQHDALGALMVGIKSRRVNWILDADIAAFFDEIDHDWMLKFLEHRIADQRMLRLIRKWLKAGVIEDGRREGASKGTPQGAVISPLLANIYLHCTLDLWTQQWRGRHARGKVTIVRYADDSVIGFEKENDARRYMAAMQERMGKFGLTLNAKKTRLIEFGRFAANNRKRRGQGKPETFDFLGFTHCCSTTREGLFQVRRLTVKKRMRAKIAELRVELMRRRHQPRAVVGKWLNRVVRGYLNYHAVPGNLFRLGSMCKDIDRAWRHSLMRRSQRPKMPWSRFSRIAQRFMPPIRNAHPYPEERFYASHT
ncbi:MAG: group II intron reverse transcriptase/maturase [Polaromonas sp.]|nr:group II intron reverse transcriptase/maturase [Polaromonas sp.]